MSSPGIAASTASWIALAAVVQFVYGATGLGLFAFTYRVAAETVDITAAKMHPRMMDSLHLQPNAGTLVDVCFGGLDIFISGFGSFRLQRIGGGGGGI